VNGDGFRGSYRFDIWFTSSTLIDQCLTLKRFLWPIPSLLGGPKTTAHAGITVPIINLETGRTHQIRVHLAEKGWPLAGDKLYGGPPAVRQALHARLLGFVHPFTGLPVTYEVPMPEEWKSLFSSEPV